MEFVYSDLLPARPGGRSSGPAPRRSPARCLCPGLTAPPVTPCPGLGRCYQCSLSPRSRPLGQQGKGRALAAEPAVRSGDTALQGSRVPHATRTNTDQSLRKLSPLLARLRPPYCTGMWVPLTVRRLGEPKALASRLSIWGRDSR